MTSLPEARYCARGERCVGFDPAKGLPQQLRRSSSDTVCSLCRNAALHSELELPIAPDEREEYREYEASEGSNVLFSSQVDRIIEFKQDVVLQLSVKHGPFWEVVRGFRDRWGIVTETRIPPLTHGIVKPRGIDEDASYVWIKELTAIRDKVIPRRFYEWQPGYWQEFVSACALYDPPATSLLEFSARFSVPLSGLVPSGGKTECDPVDVPLIAAPRVRTMQDPEKVAEDKDWYWSRILGKLVERLEASGIDIVPELLSILHDPELMQELVQREHQNQPLQYIEVDEHTGRKDVLAAWQVLRPQVSKGGQPPASQARDVECARLAEEGWSEAEIAARYGWEDTSTVAKRVKAGRRYLSSVD